MSSVLGTTAIAFASAASIVALVGRRRWITPSLFVAAGALAAATSTLLWALVTNDYTIEYVVESARRASAAPYRAAGLWGGMAGSLLLWTTMLAIWAITIRPLLRRVGAVHLDSVAQRTFAAAQALFLLPLVTIVRPFVAADSPPVDGLGLHPLLEHSAMLYHPPLLYLGLTGLFPGAAVAVAALRDRHVSPGVDRATRHSTLRAVVLLGSGLVTGAHWAYAELGWGGFWAWDPIENSALVPFLVALGALHRRRSPVGLALAATAALLAAAGSFVARSGASVSPHAFAEARDVGWILLLGVAGAAVGLGALLVARRDVIAADRGGGRLPSALLGAAAAVIAVGTFAPAIGVMAGATPRTVDASFYSRFAVPILVVAACWCARETLRGSAPTAARIAHAGVVVVAIAAAGSTTGWEATAPLRLGQTVEVHGHDVTLVSIADEDVGGRMQLVAVVTVDGDEFRPALRSDGAGGVTSETAIRSRPSGDLLLTARRITLGSSAVVDLRRRPLVPWIWFGGSTTLAALTVTALRAAPRRRRPGVSDRVAERATAVAPVRPVAVGPGARPSGVVSRTSYVRGGREVGDVGVVAGRPEPPAAAASVV